MNKMALMGAAGLVQNPPVKITPEMKAEWNRFLDYLHQKGLRGNVDLDKGDDRTQALIEEYKTVNPKTSLSPDIIKPIQEQIVADWELGRKIQALKGVKANNLDNRPLSKADGRIGSLTSNGYFPSASTTDDKGNVIKDYGYDLDSYYQSLIQEQAQKVPVLSQNK